MVDHRIEIYRRRCVGYEKGREERDTKATAITASVSFVIPEVSIHTRHYERRYFRHRRYGSFADIAIDLLDIFRGLK